MSGWLRNAVLTFVAFPPPSSSWYPICVCFIFSSLLFVMANRSFAGRTFSVWLPDTFPRCLVLLDICCCPCFVLLSSSSSSTFYGRLIFRSGVCWASLLASTSRCFDLMGICSVGCMTVVGMLKALASVVAQWLAVCGFCFISIWSGLVFVRVLGGRRRGYARSMEGRSF